MAQALIDLKIKVNKEVLEQSLQSAKLIDKSIYTDESYKVFEEAVKSSELVLYNPESSQKDVDDAISNLNKTLIG